ncbi:MAG: hypothetical protein OSA81_10680 [Longimicrobiales bacterium]|nr:hypothetical protein [Longimicrobiales bacterium]
MDHEMMAGPSGTFGGHLTPGIGFAIWGLPWLWELVGPDRPWGVADPVERALLTASLKIVAALIALPHRDDQGGLASDGPGHRLAPHHYRLLTA